MEEEYGIGPGGLSGNDDAGQLSVWYVFGALGFYPVCPVLPEYRLSGLKFNQITLHTNNGNQMKIKVSNYSEENIFINSMLSDNKEYDKNYLSHEY